MTKGKKRLRDCLGGKLRTQLENVAGNAEATWQEFQQGDNKQGHEHCEAVERNLDLLISDDKKETGLNETEIFVLLAACLLHDIGKVESSNRSGWQSEHGHRAMEIINENYDTLGLDRVHAAAVFGKLGTHDELSLVADMLKDKDEDVRLAATVILAKLATDVDAEGLLDLVAEKSQGWDEIAQSHYQALCLLDQKFYCPITPQEQT